MKNPTASQLLQYAKLKLRLQKENEKKPVNKQVTIEQIENYSKDAVSKGIVNNEGYIVEINNEFSTK